MNFSSPLWGCCRNLCRHYRDVNMRLMNLINLFLVVILLLATASGAHASLSAINLNRLLRQGCAQLSADLKVLETVAENWSPEWRHELPKEEAVSLAERTLQKIDDLLSANEVSAGELLLLKGLTAHYAYNLDMKKYFDVAVESLRKARKALPADCRPLWFLGNHYAKAADAEKGMPLLKQAMNECGDNLPLSFWEDYAYAAVLAAMPATGQYALDQVKARNSGVLTKRVKAVEEGVKKRLVSPVPGKEYEPDDLWHVRKYGGVLRLVNGMHGFMIDLPGDWRVSPFGVRNGRSGIGITLPKKGKWPPPLEVVVFVSPASPETVPEKVLRTFLANAEPKELQSHSRSRRLCGQKNSSGSSPGRKREVGSSQVFSGVHSPHTPAFCSSHRRTFRRRKTTRCRSTTPL